MNGKFWQRLVSGLVAFVIILGLGIFQAPKVEAKPLYWHIGGIATNPQCVPGTSDTSYSVSIVQSAEWPGAYIKSSSGSPLSGTLSKGQSASGEVKIGWPKTSETQPVGWSVSAKDDCTFVQPTATRPAATPTQPVVNTPTQPVVNTPTQPATPTQPVVNTPTLPVVNTPTLPVVNTPTLPVVNTPTLPVVNTPTQPVVNTPTQPVVNTPTQPVVNTPTQPVVNTPTDPPHRPVSQYGFVLNYCLPWLNAGEVAFQVNPVTVGSPQGTYTMGGHEYQTSVWYSMALVGIRGTTLVATMPNGDEVSQKIRESDPVCSPTPVAPQELAARAATGGSLPLGAIAGVTALALLVGIVLRRRRH